MRKLILAIMTVVLFTLVSCDNVYINGDLDGMWQLQKVESQGIVTYPQNTYYSFQRNLSFLTLAHEEDFPVRYLGNLSYEKEKSITLWGFRNAIGEKPLTIEDLEKFMIFDESTTFIIEEINSKQLIMHNGDRRYELRKW